jgi:hypothetical protein
MDEASVSKNTNAWTWGGMLRLWTFDDEGVQCESRGRSLNLILIKRESKSDPIIGILWEAALGTATQKYNPVASEKSVSIALHQILLFAGIV